MIRIRITVLPAAVTLILFMGACQDAPSGPRSPSTSAIRQAPETQLSGVHVYSGRSADSVANQILSAWAMNGHPEYLARRQASRKGLRLQTPGASASLSPSSTMPEHIIDGDGSDAAYKDPPRIINHNQDFFFGHYGTPNISTVLSASMSFVGDRGRIDANVTVTGKNVTYPASATLADGVGQLLSCGDMIFGSCGSSRFMEGSMVLDGAPYCDAQVSGSATFTAANLDATTGGGIAGSAFLTSVGGFTGLPAISVGVINEASRPCDTETNDPAGTGSGGSNGGDPPPTGSPAPPPAPPSYPPASTPEFNCETYRWWDANGNLEAEVTACYPD